jgi:hypothetical protein
MPVPVMWLREYLALTSKKNFCVLATSVDQARAELVQRGIIRENGGLDVTFKPFFRET